jgi:hypothetical protein
MDGMVECVAIANSLNYVQWVRYDKRNPRHWFKPRYWVWDGSGKCPDENCVPVRRRK